MAERIQTTREVKPWRRVPPSWIGSEEEYAIYWAHFALNLTEGVDFTYQEPVAGGRLFLGGAVIDFFEIDVNIAIRVMGRYFHAYAGFDQNARDHTQKISLESLGINVIDIDGEDALTIPIEVLYDARRGVERIRTRGQ